MLQLSFGNRKLLHNCLQHKQPDRSAQREDVGLSAIWLQAPLAFDLAQQLAYGDPTFERVQPEQIPEILFHADRCTAVVELNAMYVGPVHAVL